MASVHDFRMELRAQLERAQKRSAPHIEINAGELHRRLGGYPGLSFPKIPSGADSRYEAESAHHPARCSHSFSCLEGLSPICSGRGAGLRSRTSFFAISSIL